MLLWLHYRWGGGASLAYADGFTEPTADGGFTYYYGYGKDAEYLVNRNDRTQDRFQIKAEFFDDEACTTPNPLGEYVRVTYIANAHKDWWAFRPQWWFAYPQELGDPSQFKGVTDGGVITRPSIHYIATDLLTGTLEEKLRTYDSFTKDEWRQSPSNWWYTRDEKGLLKSLKGAWETYAGASCDDQIVCKPSSKFDKEGQSWNVMNEFITHSAGMVTDWVAKGSRSYRVSFVAKLPKDTYKTQKDRSQKPLYFSAGVYRYAGQWRYVIGKKVEVPYLKMAREAKPLYPAEPLGVEHLPFVDGDAGDDAYKKQLIQKIIDANKNNKAFNDYVLKDASGAITGITVANDGTVTIKYQDSDEWGAADKDAVSTMEAAKLLYKLPSYAQRFKPQYPKDRVGLLKMGAPSDQEKPLIRDAFMKANENNRDLLSHLKDADGDGVPDTDAVVVDADGGITLHYKDNSTLKLEKELITKQGDAISNWATLLLPSTRQPVAHFDQLGPHASADVLTQSELTAVSNLIVQANKDNKEYLSLIHI